jgi:multidrug efflux pump subunit AcrA (membrane-fusion protein)
VLYALIVVAVAGGVYAGARWRSSIAPLLGMSSTSESPQQESGGATQLWTCGMHSQVIQDKPGDCPICHMKLTPMKMDNSPAPAGHDHGAMPPDGAAPGAQTGEGGAQAGRKIKYWWDPMMSPPYISDRPGKSPMGMDLVPVYEEEGAGAGAAVVIDPAVVQNMGVRVALVTEAPLKKSVRLVGYLDEAQPNIRDINLRVSGWVRRLHASTEGQRVEAGDPLFDLYSPELQVAVEELITARRARAAAADQGGAGGAAGEPGPGESAGFLYDAAVKKLELLGLDPRQIEPIAKLDQAPEEITFTSPLTGDVTEKPVVEGAAVEAGQMALRIVDHTTLWLDARVFEKDLPFVAVGQQATATIASRPGEEVRGEIVFIYPLLDPMTRTALVRVSLPNPTLVLKPGMYATVRLEAEIAERAVLVPREAIIDTGERQVAVIAEAVGHFRPRDVRMGLPAEGGMVQVLEGLAPGETVVTSGQFLIDSESRLQEAIQKFLNEKQMAGVPPPPPPSPAAALPIDVSPDQQAKVDAVIEEYLRLSSVLGAMQEKDTPLSMGEFIKRAHALHGALGGTSVEKSAAAVAKSADSLRGHPIEHQREAFKALSEAVITLVDSLPPSAAVGEEIYLMNCPMAPGNWLQSSEDLANPYYATEMKRCGELVRTIPARGK